MAEPSFEVHLASIIPFPIQKYAKVPLEGQFQIQQWRKNRILLSEGRGAVSAVLANPAFSFWFPSPWLWFAVFNSIFLEETLCLVVLRIPCGRLSSGSLRRSCLPQKSHFPLLSSCWGESYFNKALLPAWVSSLPL